jgi:hypothetical protein
MRSVGRGVGCKLGSWNYRWNGPSFVRDTTSQLLFTVNTLIYAS